ncbi:DUF916 and DUF3324 domain-containing protein [Lactiplantibacillus brownii]
MVALTSLMAILGSVSSAQASSVGFTVAPVASSKQVDSKVGYFDLKLQPGATETIAVKVKNTDKEALTIDTSVSKATTSISGAVNYQKVAMNKSEDLPADLGNLVTTSTNRIQLAGGQTKTVTYQVKMPAKSFNGVLAGGITFVKPVAKSKSGSGMTINNQYAYTIAVVLHGDHDLTTNRLTLGKIKANLVNARNVISIPLENHTAAFLNQVATSVKIYHRGGSKVVYQQKTAHGQMAPNSIYKLPLKLGDKALTAGKYSAVVKVTSKKQHWTFKQDFTITGNTAKKLNQKAVITQKQTPWLLIISLIVLILIIILLLIWYIRRKQKRIKDLEQQLKDQEK